jgi:hypothetical protein
MESDRQEKLSKLHREVLQKTKEFTDTLKENGPARKLDSIYREIQSLYTDILAIKQEVASEKK